MMGSPHQLNQFLESFNLSYLQKILEVIREDQTLETTKSFVKLLVEKILIWLHDQEILVKTLQADKSLEPRVIDIFTQKFQFINKFYQCAIEKVNFQDKKLTEVPLFLYFLFFKKKKSDSCILIFTLFFFFNAKVSSITRELDATRASLDATSQQLEAAQDKLVQLEKNVDRSNSFTLNPYLLNEKKSESNNQSVRNLIQPLLFFFSNLYIISYD